MLTDTYEEQRVAGGTQAATRTARIVSGKGAAVWDTRWILMWYGVTLTWVVYGLWVADFTRGASAFIVLFFPFELWGIHQKRDAYPPLTHVIRNRFPQWFALPLIFATVASVCSRWAGLGWRHVGLITIPTAALGWLTDHFIATYHDQDPRPFSGRTTRAA